MPALVSVIWVYFGLALLLNINFSVFQAGVIALSLLYSAFLAEIFRSALSAQCRRGTGRRARRSACAAVGISTR